MTWLTDPIIALVVFLGRHPSFPMAVAIILPIAAAIMLPTSSGKPFSKPARLAFLMLALCIIANFWVGDWVANTAVYLGGVEGRAVVTSTRTLNESYNHHDVIGYNVSIQTGEGRIIKSTAKSDTFNVYPSRNELFPGKDGQFKVKYLKHIPSAFIFLSN